jgi:hypothetical protein
VKSLTSSRDLLRGGLRKAREGGHSFTVLGIEKVDVSEISVEQAGDGGSPQMVVVASGRLFMIVQVERIGWHWE